MTGELSPRNSVLAANLDTIADLLTDVRHSLARGADHGTTLLAVPRTLTPEEVTTIACVARRLGTRAHSMPLTSTSMRLIRTLEDVGKALDCAMRGSDEDARTHMDCAAARLIEAVAQMESASDGDGVPS